MIGLENTTNAIGNFMRRSYDQYATVAHLRNAMIREQLQAMQGFVAISDKLLSLPFPGLMGTGGSNEDYKELAIEMRNVFTEHSNNALEIWASIIGHQGGAVIIETPEAKAPAKKKAASPAATEPKSNGKQTAEQAPGAATA